MCNGCYRWIVSVGAVLLGSMLLSAAFAADRQELRYSRDGGAREQRPAARRPMPKDLRIEAPERHAASPEATKPEQRKARPRAAGTRPNAAAPQVERAIDRRPSIGRQAELAARWTARELFRTAGRREYYRVGFFEGLQATLDDPSLGNVAYREGLRAGRDDANAQASGFGLGTEAAESMAQRRAPLQVAEQFRDLSREPRYSPRFGEPVYDPPRLQLTEPRLEAVLVDFPLEGFTLTDNGSAVLLAGWGYDARRLTRSASYADVYDPSWKKADAAFELWAADAGRAAFYRRLGDPEAARRFRQLFEEAFRYQLHVLFHEIGSRAYNRGFDDGWAYGAFVQDEWAFRRGHVEGSRRAYDDAARSGFHRTYALSFERWYRDAFADWSENPKPEIVAVSIVDGDEDGVFEPGEELSASYELINYGGRGGFFALDLDGDVLDAPGRATVRLPARGAVRAERPLRARIAASTPPRTRTDLELRLADRTARVPLRVSYPLQFDGDSLRAYRDDLAGQVRIEVRVENQSLRPRAGTVRLAASGLAGFGEARPLGLLDRHGDATVSFALSGLDPLDLMSGKVSLEFSAIGDGVVQDGLRHRLPDTFRDMTNDDLLRYLLRLSRASRADVIEVARARELMLLRLREDWKVAAIGSGNPYKADLKGGGSRTALGHLVESYRVERDAIRQPEVLAGLGREVEAQVRTLPGAHPFLRKHAMRLARRLP